MDLGQINAKDAEQCGPYIKRRRANLFGLRAQRGNWLGSCSVSAANVAGVA